VLITCWVRAGAVLLSLVVVGAACGSDDKKQSSPTTTEATISPEDPTGIRTVVNRDPVRKLIVEVTGARTGKFEGSVKIKALTRVTAGEHKEFSVAAIEPLDQLRLPDGTIIKPEIGIVGIYTGDGTYEIPAGLGQAPTTGPTVPFPATSTSAVSVGSVTFINEGPPLVEKRYNYLLEPCKVTLSDQATVGTAECPKLVAIDGEQITLKYTWGP